MKTKLSRFSITKENLVILVYMITFSLRYFTYLSKTATAFIWSACGMFLFVHCFLRLRTRTSFLYWLAAVDILAVITGFLNGNSSYINTIYIISSQALGLELFLQQDKLRFIRNLSLIIYAFVLIQVILFRMNNTVDDVTLSNLVGKNSVSIFMIFACAIDLIYRLERNRTANYLLLVIGIAASILCNSSGGILGFIVFVIGVFFCQNNKKIAWGKTIVFFIIAVTVIVRNEYLPSIIEFLSDDNSRFAIWRMYLELVKKSSSHIVLGAPLSNNPVLFRWFNLHNNFFNWHCFMGLVPMLFFGFIVIYLGISYFKMKEWYFFVIWAVMLVRSMTDATDYCFMSLWIYMILNVLEKQGRFKNKHKRIVITIGREVL